MKSYESEARKRKNSYSEYSWDDLQYKKILSIQKKYLSIDYTNSAGISDFQIFNDE